MWNANSIYSIVLSARSWTCLPDNSTWLFYSDNHPCYSAVANPTVVVVDFIVLAVVVGVAVKILHFSYYGLFDIVLFDVKWMCIN